MSEAREIEMRRKRRAERLRRERMRVRRQRALTVLALLVAALAATAWGLRPPASPLTPVVAMASTDSGLVEVAGVQSVLVREEGKRIAKEAAQPKPLVPAPGVRTLVVDKSDQTVTAYEANGKPVDRFPCASGVVYPRVGTFEVYSKDDQSWALADDTTFFWFTKFEKSDKNNNIGFHSIPQNRDGTLVGGLGKPISHGCVRLDKAKAKFVYDWAPIGAKVVVQY